MLINVQPSIRFSLTSPRALSARLTPITRLVIGTTVAVGLSFFMGCNQPDSSPVHNQFENGEDRFHEKSFSWEHPQATPALAKTTARTTHFANPEQLGEAILGLNDSLENPRFADSLWKPVDYACDELSLALWNTYGSITLGDSVVFDEAILKSRCSFVGGNAELDSSLGKRGGASALHPSSESDHRVYPYKLIGRSWDNFNLVLYKSTGSETQFKKHRTRLFTTAWWDTDATRLGVRAYLLNCGTAATTSGTVRTCILAGVRSGSVSNSAYVSQRDFSAGLAVFYTFPGTISAAPTNLKVSDAVFGMHSANHAGIAFRASSSSGLTDATVLVSVPPREYVIW